MMKVQLLLILLVKIILSAESSTVNANPRNVQVLDLTQIVASSTPNPLKLIIVSTGEPANGNDEDANEKSWSTTAAPTRLSQQQQTNWQSNKNAQGLSTGNWNNWQRSSGNQNDQQANGRQIQNFELSNNNQNTQGQRTDGTTDPTEDSYLAAFHHSQQNLRGNQDKQSQVPSTLQTSATVTVQQGNDQNHQQNKARPGAWTWTPRTVENTNQKETNSNGQRSETRPGAYTWKPKNTNANQQNSGLSTNQNANTRPGAYSWKPEQIILNSQPTTSTTLRSVASTTARTFAWRQNSNFNSNLGRSSAITANAHSETSGNVAVRAFRLTPIRNYNENRGLSSPFTNANAGVSSWQENRGVNNFSNRNTFKVNDSNEFERVLSALTAGDFNNNEDLILVVKEENRKH